MRGLAEYVMSGRRQAATVVLLFGLIPMLNLLSAAVVALVGLRKGPQEGFLVMLWALLPAGLQWAQGNTTPVIMLFGVMLLAQLLRRTQSWPQVILGLTVLGIALQLSLALQPQYVAESERLLDEALQMNAVALAEEGLTPEEAKARIMPVWTSLYGTVYLWILTAALVIGRYWQALLYNPGGFREEFHQLRLDPRMMLLLMGLFGLGLLGVKPVDSWTMVFSVAPALCGLALAHWVVAARQLSPAVLVLTYLIAFAAMPVIMVIGLADSLLNIRKRMAQP